MKVSIITPAYNCEDYIRASIDSILNQSYGNWELVIGDDGSTDATKEIIDSYNDVRIKRYHWSKNQGYLQMFNYLLSKASGDYMMSHDADDISLHNRIEAHLEIFAKFPEVDVCGSNCIFFGDFIDERISDTVTPEGLVTIECNDLPFAPATILYKRKVYKVIGGFHPYFNRLSSMDQYWMYLIREKFSVYYLNQPLYKARMHPTSNHRSVEMSDFKKLASWDVFKLLRLQRRQTGTDSLERGAVFELDQYVEKLSNNRKWLAEKYREYSATKADVGDTRNALALGLRAVLIWPWSAVNYRTLLYSLRKRLTN